MAKRIWRWRCSSGVSLLLEVLFGLGLFGGVMLIVFGLFPTTHRSITQARRITEATNLANEFMETERTVGGTGFIDPVPGPVSQLITLGASVDGKPISNTYNITVSRATSAAGADDERQSIVVNVTWNEGPTNRTVSAEAVVTRP